MSNFKIYSKSILVLLIFGGIVGLITTGMSDYEMLIKPSAILFPIV